MPASEYRPQLATLVKEPPRGREWLHEIKYDGYRIGCRIRNGRVALYSRNGNDWTASFPEVVDAARALRTDDALIDGEVAMVLPGGRTSFQALQNAGAGNRGSLVYFVFDLLRDGGARIQSLPLEERKARLKKLLGRRGASSRIRYSEHVVGNGEGFHAQACRLGLEGIVSKRRDLLYRPGRHPGWQKTKCTLRQEFVIGGFTDPEGSRAGIGALLIGYYDSAGRLVFAGKVGTGFTRTSATQLRTRLNRLETKGCPFAARPARWLGGNAHWVRPELVGEVEFTEWTTDGKIRHPSFQGLRLDKKAREVTRETPSSASDSASRPEVLGVGISNADRVVYPDAGITKLDLARYYESIADWIVPHVRGRPLTLVRCPEGMRSPCFFMKHSKVWAPEPLRRVTIQEQKKVGEYLIADTAAAVVGLVQMGVLEIHTWNSVYEKLERPDRIVFDLDPGEEVSFSQVIDAARTVHDALSALGLASFVKTTGGRGLHIVVPLTPDADWTDCLAFSRAFAGTLVRAHAGRYTTEFAKAGRERKILIDYLRNNRTNTSIAAYSTRAKAHAPVSTPIAWEELRRSLNPASFTIRTIGRRLARLGRDPWADYWTTRQKLATRLLRAVGTSPAP